MSHGPSSSSIAGRPRPPPLHLALRPRRSDHRPTPAGRPGHAAAELRADQPYSARRARRHGLRLLRRHRRGGRRRASRRPSATRASPPATSPARRARAPSASAPRYGKGLLYMKDREPETSTGRARRSGWDFGGNASRVFTLCYNLQYPDDDLPPLPGRRGLGLSHRRPGRELPERRRHHPGPDPRRRRPAPGRQRRLPVLQPSPQLDPRLEAAAAAVRQAEDRG